VNDDQAKQEIAEELERTRTALEVVRAVIARERAKCATTVDALRRTDAELFARLCDLRCFSKQLGKRIDASFWEGWKRGEKL
jgi:hypothetical protein